MEYIKLGTSDLEVSRICFGCAPMGGYDYGDVDDELSVKAVHYAIDHGVNFFDTASIYGFGRAESVLSKALEGKRKDVVLATKGGLRRTEKTIIPDLSPVFLRTDIENSLKRLKTGHIDLYQLHYPDPKVPVSTYASVLHEFIKLGKIRYVGLSNYPISEVRKVLEVLPTVCLQLPYNPLQRVLEIEGIPALCQENSLGLITHSSLARGYLSGKVYSGNDFKGSDTRPRSTYFSDTEKQAKEPVLAVVKDIALRRGKSPAQVAVRWLLDKPFVSSAIVGVRSPKQIEDILLSCHWHLSNEEMSDLNDVSDFFRSHPLY